LVLAGLDPRFLPGLQVPETSPPSVSAILRLAEDYPFPYDSVAFSCAERVHNVRRSPLNPAVFEASLNLIIRPGKVLDLELLASDRLENLASTRDVQRFTGANDVLDAKIAGYAGDRLYYQVRYREGTGGWKALAPKSVKLPAADLDAGGEFKVVVIADDHTFDDADTGVASAVRGIKLDGDYVNEFLKTLRTKPDWEPPAEPIGKLKNGLFLARALRNILVAEDADLLLHLGDTSALGAPYRWAAYGLPATNLKDSDFDSLSQLFWLRMRKMYSAVTPHMPMVIALGNHDGEEGWNPIRFRARSWRQKYFRLPDALTYPEGGDSQGAYYAFSLGADPENRGGVRFIVLDVTGFTGQAEPAKPDGWTLGDSQLRWLEAVLAKGEKHWSFACYHHVLGGWPAGPTEPEAAIAYGRGPLFLAKDYQPFLPPDSVEQVKVTDLALKHGLRAFLYGHDHIFKPTYIGRGASDKDLYGICAGSTKHIGETAWWRGTNWQKYYGDSAKKAFVGPPGYTRLTIKTDSVKVDYVSVGYSPYSNVSSGQKAGDLLSTLLLVNPPAKPGVDRSAVAVEASEGRISASRADLRVHNAGGGVLSYRLRSKAAWLSVTPEAGKSWGEWREHTLVIASRGLPEGTYRGAVSLEAEGGTAAPLDIPVDLVIAPLKIYPPEAFFAAWMLEKTLFSSIEAILLSWRANRNNRRIAGYRAYLVDSAGARTLVGQVSAEDRKSVYRNAVRGRTYTFAVAAFDDRGREGEAAIATAS
jgi:3',5'-cyclic AMP phosphodiesterase CpdA